MSLPPWSISDKVHRAIETVDATRRSECIACVIGLGDVERIRIALWILDQAGVQLRDLYDVAKILDRSGDL